MTPLNRTVWLAAATLVLAAGMGGCVARNDYDTAVWQRDSAWEELTKIREEAEAAKKAQEQADRESGSAKSSLEEQKLRLDKELRSEIDENAKLKEQIESLKKELVAAARDRDDARSVAQSYQDAAKAQAAQIQLLQQTLVEFQKKLAAGAAAGGNADSRAPVITPATNP